MNRICIHNATFIFLFRDVVGGLAHLHNKGFQNRDLKPQRVLINFGAFPCAKICDQGIIEGNGKYRFSLGPPGTGYYAACLLNSITILRRL